MELDTVESEQQFVNRVNTSPFFMSSRTPMSSPQPWELHDVDFLLPGPITATSLQDSSRKNCTNLLDSEISFTPELEESTKPLIFRSGTFWHDMTLNGPATNEFSTYLVDEILSDKKIPRSPCKTARVKVTPPTMLRVNASACTDEELSAKRHSRSSEHTSKVAVNAVSPTMLDKKILVTDNDLRLFSSDNMKALSGKKTPVKRSPRVQHRRTKTKGALPMTVLSTSQVAVSTQYMKRRASFEVVDEHVVRALKRTKSLNQQAWTAPSFDPRWYVGATEGFHGIQPRLLSPFNSSLDYSGVNIYRRVQQQVDVHQEAQPQYSPPARKIGIYSPADRRERLKRFHEKRKHRVYHKRIKYDCRKRLANSCPRVKGRFVRKSEYLSAKESDTTLSTTSESASSSEDCQL